MFEKTGQRVFDVLINGQKSLKKKDLFKDYGFQSAVIKLFKINSANGININFAEIHGKTILSAGRIKRI